MTSKAIISIVLLSLLPACGLNATQNGEPVAGGLFKLTVTSKRIPRYEHAPRYLAAHAESNGQACDWYSDPKTGKVTGKLCYSNR